MSVARAGFKLYQLLGSCSGVPQLPPAGLLMYITRRDESPPTSSVSCQITWSVPVLSIAGFGCQAPPAGPVLDSLTGVDHPPPLGRLA